MIFDLAIKSFRNRKFTASLTILSIALSVALLLGIEKIRYGAEAGFTSTVSGTDLIVGARTSPLQLLLSSVFHIGSTGNSIGESAQRMLQQHPRVKWAIPLSLGDSYRGYNVVGTTASFYKHYRFANSRQLQLDQGQWFDDVNKAVIGADVASTLHMQLDSKLVVAHGGGDESFIEHTDTPLHVGGILQPTGTPVDRAVFVSLEAIAAMHHGLYAEHDAHGHDPIANTAHGLRAWFQGVFSHDHDKDEHDTKHADAHHDDEHGDEQHSDDLHSTDDVLKGGLNAMLLGLHSRSAALSLQREINDYSEEPLTAILPGVVLLELWQVLGVVEKILLAISAMVIVIGLFSMLIILMTSMDERRREMAILRSVGARPVHLFALIMGEALFVTVSGIILGIALLYGGLLVFQPWLEATWGLYLVTAWPGQGELLLAAVVLVLGCLVGLVPGIRVYRYSLVDGMSIRM